MKVFILSFSCLLLNLCMLEGQMLPIDFENDITTADFIDFSGGTASVTDNPQPNGINTSTKVAQIVRNGGDVWAGSKILLSENLDFSTLNTLSMKVYTSAPVGTVLKFKLEGDGSAERDMTTTVSNEWEEISWDFTGTPSDFNALVFMFDFGNVGDGSANSTFLFDDVNQYFGGFQIDLPVTFEDEDVNYTMTDFEGNISQLTTDPEDINNTVVQAMKSNDASPSAGTTIGTPAGFATNIPLSLTDSKMTVRVWTPQAGTPIRLKVEDSNDPTHTCETETNTTVSGQWETLVFDFSNEAPGTESLSVGLSKGWTFNMASIFFNFATSGANDGGTIYYFDDVKFGDIIQSNAELTPLNAHIYPNPTSNGWNIDSDKEIIQILIYNQDGRLVENINPNSVNATISGLNWVQGIYYIKIMSKTRSKMSRLVKI